MRARQALAAALCAAAPLAGCASAPPPAPAAVVTVSNIAYSPATVTIPVGGSVRWDFADDGILHHVMGDGLDSGIVGTGSYTHTFNAPGTYSYHCSVHTVMAGAVIVTPEEP
ncbi:plastocyanin/azurin family copper-binding protein [Actinocorallia sp. A-T 12471]|uniref:cupredoxin domain-containing protein n=1 Tax=Actinocorallia sp. A-T 12471 TaxID=3089813 RepID=UPI0029D1A4EE|nr:plastocyanin/azurin family copper-binding protein [Actinocorallia sp. A-T 12471]MDX6739550.1 cupredoxin domain-containing protein [Actinocorallia sp. A-T 12471]